MSSHTITNETNPITAVWHSITGGKFRVRLTIDKYNSDQPGKRYGDVLDNDGNRIGDASDYIYGGRGFAIHTRPFGGFVPLEQIEFVE